MKNNFKHSEYFESSEGDNYIAVLIDQDGVEIKNINPVFKSPSIAQ